jgi:hypothetical protein
VVNAPQFFEQNSPQHSQVHESTIDSSPEPAAAFKIFHIRPARTTPLTRNHHGDDRLRPSPENAAAVVQASAQPKHRIAMDPLEIIIASLASLAGVFTATLTTVACYAHHTREERDREIFRAYLDCPQEVEAWLVQGAMEHLKQTLPWQLPERTRRIDPPQRVRGNEENAMPMLASRHQVA